MTASDETLQCREREAEPVRVREKVRGKVTERQTDRERNYSFQVRQFTLATVSIKKKKTNKQIKTEHVHVCHLTIKTISTYTVVIHFAGGTQ